LKFAGISQKWIIVKQILFVEGDIEMRGSGSLLSLLGLTLLQNEYGTLDSNLFWELSISA